MLLCISNYQHIYTHIYTYLSLSLSLSLYIYIHWFVHCICILKRLPPLPPTSGTRGMDAWMLGCLSLCSLVADVAPIWIAFWRPWVTCGVTWDGPCKLVGAFGLDWVSQGTQMSHLALLCRREHRFREICWILGPETWHPVAACGDELHPSRSPIEE